jgi:hypothetical protein
VVKCPIGITVSKPMRPIIPVAKEQVTGSCLSDSNM